LDDVVGLFIQWSNSPKNFSWTPAAGRR
jgi:hypothetical protein